LFQEQKQLVQRLDVTRSQFSTSDSDPYIIRTYQSLCTDIIHAKNSLDRLKNDFLKALGIHIDSYHARLASQRIRISQRGVGDATRQMWDVCNRQEDQNIEQYRLLATEMYAVVS